MVPHFYIANPTELSLYSAGRINGLVLDMGEGITKLASIIDGKLTKDRETIFEMGGRTVIERLCEMLQVKNIKLKSRQPLEILREMAHKQCYASSTP